MEPDHCNGDKRGWAIAKDYANQSLPVMEPSAALTMLMAMQHLELLLPKEVVSNIQPYVEEAKITLQALGKNAYKAWQDKTRIIPNSPLLPSKIEDETIQVIYEGLLKNKKIKAIYNGKPDQTITPLGIVQRGNQFYLICTFANFTDIRITALQRYSAVSLLNEGFKPNKDFDLDEYINSGEMAWPWDENKNIKLQIEANPRTANYLSEFPLSLDQKISPSKDTNWQKISASVLDSHELRWWLLSQGDAIKIIKPIKLQKWLIETIDNTKDLYK
jgi:predicted DNA-binding transcriptional regulator YafY